MKSKFKIHKLGDFITEVSVRNNKKDVGEVFSVTNSQGFIKSTDYFDKEVFSKNISNYKIVSPNQFAYNPSRINVGSIAFLQTDFEVAISPLYVVFQCKKNLLPDYLLRYLKSPVGINQIRNKTRGAVRDTLTLKSLSEINIPVPSIQEQLKIIKLLSIVEQTIDKRERSIQVINKLMKSLFTEMFGHHSKYSESFTTKTLDEVSVKITDGEHGTVAKIENGALYLMARNISTDNSIDLSEVSYISKENHERIFRRCNPEIDDLLLVCVGATIGRCALVPDMGEFSLARSVALIKPDRKQINSKFLLHLFNTQFIQRQIKSQSNAAAQAGLYTGKLKEIEVPVPKVKLQIKFANAVEKIEALKSTYKKSLATLFHLQSSVSSQAFQGELALNKIDIEHIIPVTTGGGEDYDNLVVVSKTQNRQLAKKEISVLKTTVNTHFKNKAFSYQELAERIQASLVEKEYDYNKIKNEVFNSLKGKTDIKLKQFFNEKDKTILLQKAK